jgi:hypothetical protein
MNNVIAHVDRHSTLTFDTDPLVVVREQGAAVSGGVCVAFAEQLASAAQRTAAVLRACTPHVSLTRTLPAAVASRAMLWRELLSLARAQTLCAVWADEPESPRGRDSSGSSLLRVRGTIASSHAVSHRHYHCCGPPSVVASVTRHLMRC